MARLYPPDIPPDAPRSEQAVYRALQQLDDGWLVFHSVAWQSKRAGREGDGEVDFVIVHRARGVIVLEVKGGGVRVTDGVWTTIDGRGEEHRIKNPFHQATASKHALIAYLHALSPAILECRVEHAVAFPDIRVDVQIGTYGPRDLIIDRYDLSDIPAAIRRIVTHWKMTSNLTQQDMSRLVGLLAPTVTFTRRLRDDVAEVGVELAKLTREQMRTLQVLGRERRAVVLGCAGTGKTILCIERARELERQSFKTAVICYNAPLASWLVAQVSGSDILVQTFHALCIQQAVAARLPVPPSPDDEWWESTAPLLLLESAAATGLKFDAILVDEGQDFSSSWLATLEAILTSADSPMYMFADPHQELFHRGFQLPPWPRHSLMLNCRNSLPIAERVSEIFHEPPPIVAATGPPPLFVSAPLNRDGRKIVQRLVQRLLDEEGLEPEQVVVLSDDNAFLNSLRELLIGSHSFTRLGGHGVVAETVSRFKGLEAEAVVLCMSDRSLSTSQADSVLYVGLSRARSLLFVVGSEAVRTYLHW